MEKRGGARKNAGRKALDDKLKRNKSLKFDLTEEERNNIYQKLEKEKKEENLKSKTEALISIFEKI